MTQDFLLPCLAAGRQSTNARMRPWAHDRLRGLAASALLAPFSTQCRTEEGLHLRPVSLISDDDSQFLNKLLLLLLHDDAFFLISVSKSRPEPRLGSSSRKGLQKAGNGNELQQLYVYSLFTKRSVRT